MMKKFIVLGLILASVIAFGAPKDITRVEVNSVGNISDADKWDRVGATDTIPRFVNDRWTFVAIGGNQRERTITVKAPIDSTFVPGLGWLKVEDLVYTVPASDDTSSQILIFQVPTMYNESGRVSVSADSAGTALSGARIKVFRLRAN